MRVSIKELRNLIKEAYMLILKEENVPLMISKNSVEILAYPPGTTRTQMGQQNKKDYFIALDRAGNVVADGESEDDIIRTIKGKYLFVKRKKGQPLYRNATKNPVVSPTEYVSLKDGRVAGETDEKGNWIG